MLRTLQLALDVLPSFLFQARDRLTCLTSFTWSHQVSVAVHVLTLTRAHGGEKLLVGGVLAAALPPSRCPMLQLPWLSVAWVVLIRDSWNGGHL